MVTRHKGKLHEQAAPATEQRAIAPAPQRVQFDPIPALLRPLGKPLSTDPLTLFDLVHERLAAGLDAAETVDRLSDSLWWLHSDMTPGRWLTLCETARRHPLMGLLQESPFLRRAFAKPRGYDGDPVLMDMLFDGVPPPEEAEMSPIGQRLFARDLNMPFAMALRERRGFIATVIDHVADTVPDANVLIAGCGHMREADLSSAVREDRLGLLLAMDPDATTLNAVADRMDGRRVETLNRGVTAALDRTLPPADFDLVVVNGTYEYLMDRFAQALTRGFFELLRPGGRLLIGCPVPGFYDRPYLECFGDWSMTCRDPAEVQDLHRAISRAEIATARVYTRRSPDIMYLELRRRGPGVG